MLNSDNLGGIVSIHVVAIQQIASMPLLNVRADRTVGPVVLSSGGWNEQTFLPYSAVMTVSPVNVGTDEFFDVSLTMDVPNSQDVGLNTATSRFRLVADVEDMNGQRWLVGTKEDPLMIRVAQGTGGKPGDAAVTKWVLSGRFRHRPPVYAP
jgi:hypothetical protein